MRRSSSFLKTRSGSSARATRSSYLVSAASPVAPRVERSRTRRSAERLAQGPMCPFPVLCSTDGNHRRARAAQLPVGDRPLFDRPPPAAALGAALLDQIGEAFEVSPDPASIEPEEAPHAFA